MCTDIRVAVISFMVMYGDSYVKLCLLSKLKIYWSNLYDVNTVCRSYQYMWLCGLCQKPFYTSVLHACMYVVYLQVEFKPLTLRVPPNTAHHIYSTEWVFSTTLGLTHLFSVLFIRLHFMLPAKVYKKDYTDKKKTSSSHSCMFI